jgi:protein O-mannosyl-transferase
MNKTWSMASLGGALIVLLTLVVYLPALRGGFIWDDGMLITENSMIKAGNGLYRFWLTRESLDYWPLTSTAWWLEWRLWGASAVGYHVLTVLWHALNAVLVWMVLKQLKVPGAWWAALVFALHPVNVATVAWISEQKNTLSMLFYLTSLLLYLKFDGEGRWRWYGLSLVAFLLALLSKAAVVMLPVVLLGCVWWRHRRIGRQQLWYSLPYFVLSLALGLVTIWFQHHQAAHAEVARSGGPFARLAAAGWMPWFYLYQDLLPLRLNMIYPQWEIDPADWVVYVPGVLLVGGLLLLWWKRRSWGRPLLFGLGYFVITLFPVLGFFDQSYHRFTLVADHWQYYSIVGVSALVVAGWEKLLHRVGERGRSGSALVGVAALLALAVATWTRAGVYANSETLWQDTVTKNPQAWAGHNNLGLALLQAGQPEKAAAAFQRALQLKPDFADACNNLGIALKRTGRFSEAIRSYEQALQIKPNFAEAYYNLGDALEQVGRIEDAINQYEQALRIQPDLTEAHYSLGGALVRLGRVEEGMKHWEQALRIKPDYVGAHVNLGNVLLNSGQAREAAEHYEQALRLKPDYAEAHSNLGVALMRLGRTPEAIAHFEQALRINPDFAEAHYSLGGALEQDGRIVEATEQYKQALRIKPDLIEAQESLTRLQSAR